MPITTQFDIYFSGTVMEGRDPAEVRTAVGQLFKAGEKQLEQLFSGRPIKIKSGVDLDTASKYRLRFRDVGALIDICPAGEMPKTARTAPGPRGEPAPAAEESMSLLPPRSGSLIDCAPEVTPVPIPDTSDIALDNPGVLLDKSAPPPPPDIDTDELSLDPPNTGSLEDCAEPVEAVKIPDISALELVEPEVEEGEDG